MFWFDFKVSLSEQLYCFSFYNWLFCLFLHIARSHDPSESIINHLISFTDMRVTLKLSACKEGISVSNFNFSQFFSSPSLFFVRFFIFFIFFFKCHCKVVNQYLLRPQGLSLIAERLSSLAFRRHHSRTTLNPKPVAWRMCVEPC